MFWQKIKSEDNYGVNLSTIDLLKVFKQEGCPVCKLVKQTIDRYFDSMLYEFVNDPGVRDSIRKSLGYCKEHTAQILKVAENNFYAFGLSIIVEDLTNEVLKRYENIYEAANKRKKVEQSDNSQCPACLHQRDFEQIYISELSRWIADETFLNEFKKSGGLCIKHLIDISRIIKNKRDLKRLFEFHITQLKELQEDLNNFIKKHDYRNKEIITVEEATAFKKALRKITGELFNE